MIETCAMETRDGGGNSLCPCVSPLHPHSFWRPLIISGACYLGYTDPKLHWPCWILWLGLCSDMPLLISVRQTLSSLWQGECLISHSFTKHGLVCYWCCFVTIFVSPFSERAAAYLRSLSKACICHKAKELVLQWWKMWQSISLWLNQEYNFILTQWILACLAGAWK